MEKRTNVFDSSAVNSTHDRWTHKLNQSLWCISPSYHLTSKYCDMQCMASQRKGEGKREVKFWSSCSSLSFLCIIIHYSLSMRNWQTQFEPFKWILTSHNFSVQGKRNKKSRIAAQTDRLQKNAMMTKLTLWPREKLASWWLCILAS